MCAQGTASSLTLNIDGYTIEQHPLIQVSPGSLSESQTKVSFANPTDPSGTDDIVTIDLEDANGNTIPSYSSKALSLELTRGTSTGILTQVTQTSTPGVFTANFIGIEAGTAKTLHLSVDRLSILHLTPIVQVDARRCEQRQNHSKFGHPDASFWRT